MTNLSTNSWSEPAKDAACFKVQKCIDCGKVKNVWLEFGKGKKRCHTCDTLRNKMKKWARNGRPSGARFN